MKLELMTKAFAMQLLPERLVGLMTEPLKYPLYYTQDNRVSVVMYMSCGGPVCLGVAVKSPQDKPDSELGLRLALVRCLRDVGVLPKAKSNGRHKRQTNLMFSPVSYARILFVEPTEHVKRTKALIDLSAEREANELADAVLRSYTEVPETPEA